MPIPYIPEPPVEGEKIPASWGRAVVEALRSLVPIKTATVRPAVTPQGTAYHAEAQKAQQAAAIYPFVFFFKQTSSTGGDWVQGKGYIAGVDVLITNQPTTISGVTTTTYYWILHDFAAATLIWRSGASYTDSNSDTQEVYRMLEITCEDSEISSFICPNPCDIHATAKST